MLWCGKKSKIQAVSGISHHFHSNTHYSLTREARREPPNQTAYLWRLWLMTSTSTPDDCGDVISTKTQTFDLYQPSARSRSILRSILTDGLRVVSDRASTAGQNAETSSIHPTKQCSATRSLVCTRCRDKNTWGRTLYKPRRTSMGEA